MQQCQTCTQEVGPDMFFCAWCQEYLGTAGAGKKANIFTRWFAFVIDPGIAICAWLIPTFLFATVSPKLASIFAILFPLGYVIWFLSLLGKGLTPGKLVMGLRVVDQRNGDIPGFGKMFLREIVGRFLSGLFFGLGYFWSLFDKNAQAWHDKLAGTVVIKKAQAQYASRASA